MNNENTNPNDANLSALLREARATPSLPPRFQENVWRRIEESEAPAATRSRLDAFASWVLRPKFALSIALVLVMAGSLAGVHQGRQAARQDAQTRYLTAVAPNSLR